MNWVRIALVIPLAWIGFHFGTDIKLSAQWEYFEALRTTSSIVFGILGALLAIVYPEVLKHGMRGAPTALADIVDFRRVVDPLAYSGLLLILLVALGPAFAWIGAIEFTKSSLDEILLQKAAFSLLCSLSYWQIQILIMPLLTFDRITIATEDTVRRAQIREELHRNGPG